MLRYILYIRGQKTAPLKVLMNNGRSVFRSRKPWALACVASLLVSVIGLVGCQRKHEPLEQMQEPMSMESLSMLGSEADIPPEAPMPETRPAPQAPQPAIKPEVAPVTTPTSYKPTAKEIQTALTNAGYYKGPIDGKIGPMSKKAILDFQRDNALETDGKVGPKTWGALGGYLYIEPPSSSNR